MPGPEGQLELFDVGQRPLPAPRRYSLGRVFLHARYDQLVLAGIAGIIGLTIVFAGGVERGKSLVRAERVIPPRASVVATAPAQKPAASAPKASAAAAATAPAKLSTTSAATPAPAAKKKAAPAAAPKSARSKFAIQVSTFSRMQLARAELERLQSRGEAAFLVTRGDMTTVYVGPFTTRTDATTRLGRLKSRYQDCFLKSL